MLQFSIIYKDKIYFKFNDHHCEKYIDKILLFGFTNNILQFYLLKTKHVNHSVKSHYGRI